MTILAARPDADCTSDTPCWSAAPELVFHEPADGGQPWVVEAPGGRYVRLGADAVSLLRAARGLSASELAAGLGPRWDEATAAGALGEMAKLGLVGYGAVADVAVPTRPRRVRFAAPASVQLTLLDPAAWMERHQRLVSRLASTPVVAALLGLGALGLLVLAAQAPVLITALATPLPLPAVLATFAAFLAISSVHELGHAVTLHRAGGRVRRLGAMVLYLSPVLFCDTSDGWRLPDRRARVRVSLAGVVVNFGFGGIVSLAAVLVSGEARTCMLVLSVLCFTGAALNLLPVVKFDGYLALMAALDLPYLRVKAVEDWRSLLAVRLFGGRRRMPELPGRPWAPPFGLASAVAPAALVAVAGWNLFEAVGNWGRAGAALRLLAVTAAAWLVLRSGWRLVRRGIEGGARPWRLAIGSSLLLAAVAALLSLHVPDTLSAGYVVEGAQVRLVVGPAEEARLLVPGAPVELEQQGLALKREVGRGVLAGTPQPARIPLSAVIPFLTTSARTAGYGVPLAGVHFSHPHGATGAASVHLGSLRAGRWIAERLVAAPVKTLFG